MANRDMTMNMYSFEKARKFVNARVSFGATGAPTLDGPASKGVLSVTRNSAGSYTFVFGVSVNGINQIDGYTKLLSVRWIPGVDALGTGVSPAAANPVVLRQDLLSGFNLAPPVQSAASTVGSGGTLSDTTAYYYVVTAVDSKNKESLASNEQTVTTGSSSNLNSNVITWAVVPGAVSYRVYRGTAAGAENVVYTVAFGSTTTYTDTGAATQASAASPVIQARPPIAQGSITIETQNGSFVATDPAALTSVHVEFEFGDSEAA